MNLSTFFLAFLCLESGMTFGDYVPGTPGAAWSVEEMLAVKNLLHQVMEDPTKWLQMVPEGPVSALGDQFTGAQIFERYDVEIGSSPNLGDAVLPNLAKIIRLAFHDCLPDTETGGCNGCLSFANMGKEGDGRPTQGCQADQSCKEDKLPKETDNNNLLWVARVLELIYNDNNLQVPKFKKGTEVPAELKNLEKARISGSLKENGKSRADLWAFAGLTALELGVQYHNAICDADDMSKYCGGNPYNDGCEVKLPMPVFQYGRKDCTQACQGVDSFYGFCTPATENHPDPQGNGKSVTDYFDKEFGLNAKESIALMGVHTLGHANEVISGFRHYAWTHQIGKNVINNDYYKLMVQPFGWKRLRQQGHSKLNNKCKNQKSTFIGDEHGSPVKVQWVTRSQWQNNDGGPWNWSPFSRKCDPRICATIEELAPTSCCHYFDDSGICTLADSQCNKGWCDVATDKFDCSEPGFMAANMMNVDMGLYVDFDIVEGDENGVGHGRPTGCEGLNRKSWLDNDKIRRGKVYPKVQLPVYTEEGYLDYSSKKMNGVGSPKHSDVVAGKRFSGCGLNTDPAGPNQETMHEMVEEYASDNSLFIQDFSAVFKKMISNGYQSGNKMNNNALQDSSWAWVNMRCQEAHCIIKT